MFPFCRITNKDLELETELVLPCLMSLDDSVAKISGSAGDDYCFVRHVVLIRIDEDLKF